VAGDHTSRRPDLRLLISIARHTLDSTLSTFISSVNTVRPSWIPFFKCSVFSANIYVVLYDNHTSDIFCNLFKEFTTSILMAVLQENLS